MRHVVVVPVALALFSSFACASGSESILKPSMVSPEFKTLDAPKQNPFAQPKTKIEVMKVGIGNYDQFFTDAAKVKGTVVLADVVLRETDTFISTTKKNVKGGRALTPAEQRQLGDQKTRMGALVKLLEGVPQRSEDLAKTSEGLTKGAEKTFIGPNAVKLPGVLKGLGDSTGDLKDAATKAPDLLKHAQSTASELTKLAG